MTADGDVITVSRDTDETTYLAACLSLGALGVILSVKVQCEPAFHLEQIRYGARREKVGLVRSHIVVKGQCIVMNQ